MKDEAERRGAVSYQSEKTGKEMGREEMEHEVEQWHSPEHHEWIRR
jgi:hypothetical protein